MYSQLYEKGWSDGVDAGEVNGSLQLLDIIERENKSFFSKEEIEILICKKIGIKWRENGRSSREASKESSKEEGSKEDWQYTSI